MTDGNGFESGKEAGIRYVRWILSKRLRKKAKELEEIYDNHRSWWYNPKYLLDKAYGYTSWARELEDMTRPVEDIRLVS